MNIKVLLIGAAALGLPAAAAFAQDAVSPPAGAAQASEGAAEANVQATDSAGAATAGDGQTAAAGAVSPATTADVSVGKTVLDAKGGMVGTIEKVDANGAVIATGTARVQIPVTSFAKNDRGLVISATKSELEAAAKASSPS